MKINNQIKFLISAFLGAIIYFVLFGFKSFNLTDIEWLKDQGDFAMNYAGWAFYKNDPWTLPLTKTVSYGYPVGSSLVYTDSVPIFAVLFKLISPWLPNHFQYLSIWVLLITIAQVYVAAKIFSFFIEDNIIVFAGSILLVICPVFMSRAFLNNIALGSHFILLYSIYLFLVQQKKQEFKSIPWIILFAFSTVIHPQLTLIGYLIFAGHLSGLFINKNIKLKQAFVSLLLVAAATVITGFVFGIFDPGVKAAGTGFGYYTFNFNSFINPMYIPVNIGVRLSQNGNGQGDGQSYLGAALILCIVPFFLYLAKTGKLKHFFSKRYIAYHIIIVCGTALACAGNISFGSFQIIRIPIPHKVSDILSFARASSRFVWPFYYLLYIYLIVFSIQLLGGKKNLARLFVIIILGIQIFDLYPFLSFAKGRFDTKPAVTTEELKSFLKESAFINKHIFLYPTDKSYYNSFAFEAADNRQTQNAGYFAREQTATALYADNLMKEVLGKGKRIDSTIMVLKNKNLPIIIDSLYPGSYNFFRIQNFDIAIAANPQLVEKFKKFLFTPAKLAENDLKKNGMITLIYNSDGFANICATKSAIDSLNQWCPKQNWTILQDTVVSKYGTESDSLTMVLSKMGVPYFGTAASKRKGRTLELFNHTFYIEQEKSFILQVPVNNSPYAGVNLYY